MIPQMISVAVATDGSGAFSKTIQPSGGRFLQMRYVPDGSSPLDTGSDIDLAGATSGYVYLNQDNIGTSAYELAPRQATSDETGAALLYAAAGEAVTDFIYLAGEPLTFTVANGGDTKSGTFYFWFG